MKLKVSELRHAKVLPGEDIEEFSTKQYSGITVADDKFLTTQKWWKYEQYLNIHFDEGKSVPGDITKQYGEMCSDCKGACCKDIPTHNLRMYVSPSEIEKICSEFNIKNYDFIEDYVSIEDTEFGILRVKKNGDCSQLTNTGCNLGDYRPLWCKLWICENLQEKIGGVKNEYRSSQVSKK